MSSGVSRALDRVRQPEYTGENRCIPCTIVNVLIAAGITLVVAVLSPPLAAAVFVGSIAAIYVRGYLVPGTPTLTKRYFPDWLLAVFDKGPTTDRQAAVAEAENADTSATESSAEPTFDGDIEGVLLDHDIVVPCDDVDDLCLDEEVRTRWRELIEPLRTGDRTDQIAAYLGVDADDVSTTMEPDRAVARVDGRLAAWWESEAALIADIAADDLLADYVPEWEQWGIRERSQVVGGLRLFLEACPSCRGPVSLDEETVKSCCRSEQIYAVTCEECGARLLETEPGDVDP